MVAWLPGPGTALLAGLALDAAVGDPRRGHPVAGFGRAATSLQRRLERDDRARGAAFAALATAGVALPAAAASRAARRRPALRALLTAGATWTVVGGTTLHREARAVAAAIDRGDLAAARARLPHLAGRDPAALDAAGLRRAVLESVAENTSDAVVGPLLWGACAGVPGLLTYRAVNTLDAMVGHRSPRYARFGWASARLDDLANLAPARLTAALAAALAPAVGGSPRAALAAWRAGGRRHPSPNAGPVEAAFAGALGIRLGGRTPYPYGVSDRPVLNPAGRVPQAGDVQRAVRLSRRVGLAAGLLAAAALGARR